MRAFLAALCGLACALSSAADPSKANQLNSEGVELYIRGDYEGAEKKFDEAIAEAGDDRWSGPLRKRRPARSLRRTWPRSRTAGRSSCAQVREPDPETCAD